MLTIPGVRNLSIDFCNRVAGIPKCASTTFAVMALCSYRSATLEQHVGLVPFFCGMSWPVQLAYWEQRAVLEPMSGARTCSITYKLQLPY